MIPADDCFCNQHTFCLFYLNFVIMHTTAFFLFYFIEVGRVRGRCMGRYTNVSRITRDLKIFQGRISDIGGVM